MSMDVREVKEFLLHFDDWTQQQQPNPLLACISSASVIKNGFVLTQISRFRQVIGVFTFMANSEAAKATWLTHLHAAQEKYQEACKKSPASPLTYTWSGDQTSHSPKRGRGKPGPIDKRSESVEVTVEQRSPRRRGRTSRNGSESSADDSTHTKEITLSSPSRSSRGSNSECATVSTTPTTPIASASQLRFELTANTGRDSDVVVPTSPTVKDALLSDGFRQSSSRSPPRSPSSATKTKSPLLAPIRSKRNTLRALHEKAKTMDVIYL